MKVTDLRINNTYLSVKFNTPVKLTVEDIAELVNIADGASIDSYIDGMFKPIELNNNCFKKAGFKKQKCYGISNYWSIKIHETWYSFYEKGGYWYMDHKYTVTFKYFHEIQNMIKVLTGIQLEL